MFISLADCKYLCRIHSFVGSFRIDSVLVYGLPFTAQRLQSTFERAAAVIRITVVVVVVLVGWLACLSQTLFAVERKRQSLMTIPTTTTQKSKPFISTCFTSS